MEERPHLDQIVALITQYKQTASEKIRNAIGQIISLAYDYPYHDKRFRFSIDPDLDDNVYGKLIALADELMFEMEDCAWQSKLLEDEDDDDSFLPFLLRDVKGEDLRYRVDKHMTRLRQALEAYIAVGFVNGMTQMEVYNAFLANIGNPWGWELMKKAYEKSGYTAEGILARGFTFGSHTDRNVMEGLGFIGTQAIIEGNGYGATEAMRKAGATGWQAHRGSGYDCGLCDEECSYVHPITEIFSGFHPRCMCWITPVFNG